MKYFITLVLLVTELMWTAPEHLEEFAARRSQSGDVFSYGIILHEILVRNLPYATFESVNPKGESASLSKESINVPPFLTQVTFVSRYYSARAQRRKSAIQTMDPKEFWETPIYLFG